MLNISEFKNLEPGWLSCAPPSAIVDVEYQIQELVSEIERHHRDFTRIQRIIDGALGNIPKSDEGDWIQARVYRAALKHIRNIVG
jgi:hypothetical protein